ncbi:hypothetical protein Tco_0413343, partial [Tanacetum coccineum]
MEGRRSAPSPLKKRDFGSPAERKARSYRERMDAIFGRRPVDPSEAGDPVVEMPKVVPATESSTTLAASS